MRTSRAVVIAIALTFLTACGSAADDEAEAAPTVTPAAPSSTPEQTEEPSAESSSPTPTEEAEPEGDIPEAALTRIAALPQVDEVVTVTEDNDPNDMIGRPNGYVAAFVTTDNGLTCPELGASCGGTLEVWPDGAAAQDRSDYIQGILKDTPAFGTEYHYIDGATLLRIVGDVKPSSAKEYEAAFTG